MKKLDLDLLVVGVGGQGIIAASDVIGETALSAGYDVKKTDAIGMAQRGGSVVSQVRIACQVWSPLIKEGEVDLLIAFEKLEAARWGYYLRSGGIALVNNLALPPLSVNLGKEQYPSNEEITSILEQWTDRICIIDGTNRARQLGDVRALSMFMLGCASLFIPFEPYIWKDSISRRFPASIRKINTIAFEQGRKEIKDVHL